MNRYTGSGFAAGGVLFFLVAQLFAAGADDLPVVRQRYRNELQKTREAGCRTLTGEILAAEAAVSAAVAERGESLPQKKSDPAGKEASQPWQAHQAEAIAKYEQAIAALQQARSENLPALPRDGKRDLWFGGNYRVYVPGASWAGIGMEEDPSADMAWRAGRSMEFERTMKSYGLDFMGVAGAPFRWSACEPEKGEYDFSTASYFLKEMEKLGIYTRVNVFPEGRAGAKDLPDWFKEEYAGEYEFITADGDVEVSHNMSFVPISAKYTPGVSWGRPVKAFALQAAEEVKKHDNVLFANFSPEQMFWGRSYPYTPVFVDGFRVWLKEKYQTIDALNRRWGSAYTGFEEVSAPRFNNRRSRRAYDWEKESGIKDSSAAVYDYVTYADDALIEYEREKKRWYDQGSGGTTHMLGGKGPDMYFLPIAGFARSGLNLWKAKGNDRGLSNCDLYSVEPADWALNVDVVTSINDHGAFAIEFNRSDRGLAPNWHLFRGMDDWEYRACIWTGIGHGLKGGSFWELLRLKPLKWGVDYAAIDEDFLPLDIGMEIIRANRQTALLSEVISGALPKRDQVAFYFPHETFNQRFNFKDEYAWSVEMCGLHEMLIRAGYAPYFLSDENIEEINDYPVVVVPNAPIIPEHSNKVLADYVKKGGRLVAFGMPARVDELMRAVNGHPLRGVFGADVSPSKRTSGTVSLQDVALTLPAEYEFTPEALGGKRTCVESKSFVQEERYSPYNLDLAPAGATVQSVWADGAPAVIENRMEKGTAVLTGFLPGQKYISGSLEERAAMQQWLRGLLGTEPPIICNNQQVMASVLKNENGRFLILVNRSDEPQEVSITVQSREESGVIEKRTGGPETEYDLLRQVPATWEGKNLMLTIAPHMPAVFVL